MGFSKWMKGLVGGDPGGPPLRPTEAAAEQVKRGVAALGANQFDVAVGAFHEAVRLDPGSASNHVNLAFALQQTDAEHGALRHLREAVALDPASFDAQYMLGGALERSDDSDGAIAHLREAVGLRPDFEPARIDLCRLLAAGGDLAAAREAIDAAVALNPDNPDIQHYLGNVHMAQGDAPAAQAAYERALALQPGYTGVLSNLGLALNATKDFKGAADAFEAALANQPDLREAHYGLGMTRKAQGRPLDAIACLKRSLAIDPEHLDSLNEIGMLELRQGLMKDAIDHLERVVQLNPDHSGGYNNLGLAFMDKGDIDRALRVYRDGLKLGASYSLHNNIGLALLAQGYMQEAIEEFRQALALKPDDVGTHTNLAVAISDGVSAVDGLAVYREILERHPDYLKGHSNLLFHMTYSADSSAEQYLAEAARFDAKLPRGPLPVLTSLDAPSSEARRLRVGFVSGDLFEHPVGYFIEGILHDLDTDRLELFAYASTSKFDALSERIRPRFAQWRLLVDLTDEGAAELIRSDAIDVLIDLSGHSAHNRLPVFALRAAPVQLSWLGYFASTGVAEMDYILVDEGCVPAGSEGLVSERVWRLPHTRLCYTAPSDTVAPPVAPLPAVTNGHLTFGCFQRFPKINDDVLQAWGRTFASLPDARLVLQAQQCVSPVLVERMLARLAAVGIERERVVPQPAQHRTAYFASYSAIDIALDTFPFNGGTTTCDALWMGVPTLTLAGRTMLSRQGAALMMAAGLPEWVAANIDDYVAKAVTLGRDIDTLQRRRAAMREQVRRSPLFDTKGFARDFENALFEMWRRREPTRRVDMPEPSVAIRPVVTDS